MTLALEPEVESLLGLGLGLGLVEGCPFSEFRGPGREGRFRARCALAREARLGAGLDAGAV